MPVDPVSAGIAGVQAIAGTIQTISASNKIKKLLAQRTAYKTPEEYFDILNATQSMAQNGYDPVTLDYLTNQNDRSLSSSLSAATRLGADPNQLSALFDQSVQNIFKIGAENAQLNMKNFSRYLDAMDVIGQNKAAEWSSEQDIIKDKLQAASAEKAAGIQNIGSAANAAISMSAASQTADLYGAEGTVTQGVGGSTGTMRTPGLLSSIPSASALNAGTSPANALGGLGFRPAITSTNPLSRGTSPATAFSNIPYNPAFFNTISGLSAYLNRGR